MWPENRPKRHRKGGVGGGRLRRRRRRECSTSRFKKKKLYFIKIVLRVDCVFFSHFNQID
jgi:hypothetical protein